MNKIRLYLEVVPLPLLLGAMVGAVVVFLLIPAKYRMPAALSLMMIWLTLGEMVDLGRIQALAKLTGFAMYGLVAVTAWLDPAPRRRTPPLAWMYLALAALAFIFISTVRDFAVALAIRVQWMIMVVAVLSVSRTIVDEASLQRVIRAITFGLAVALLVPLSALVLHPNQSFHGLGRFFPYGTNANHIGVLFAMAGPLTLYWAIRTRILFLKPVLIGFTAMAVGMGLLTASRSTMIVMIGASFPLVVTLTRRPVLTAVAGLILAGSIAWMFGFGGNVQLERFKSLETGRVEIGKRYLQIIAERPFLGLLETEGESFLRSEFTGQMHAHNGYLETLYFGGIVYGIPMFFMVGYTGLCAFRSWKNRRMIVADRLLINLLTAFMVMTFAHGFVNHALYYPTTTLAFFHILLSVFFMGLVVDLRRGGYGLCPAGEEDRDWSYAEFDEQYLADDAIEPAAPITPGDPH